MFQLIINLALIIVACGFSFGLGGYISQFYYIGEIARLEELLQTTLNPSECEGDSEGGEICLN